MSRTLFVTGTDTGAGKTQVTRALIRRARELGARTCGWKPVASGCEETADGLRNADALALEAAARSGEPYELINPFAYAPPVAPHLAAAAAKRPIRVARLEAVHAELAARHELILAEGAGGWRTPLDETWTLGSWVGERGWPVILVVGMRLGCLNHALLTAESVQRAAKLEGWIANLLPEPMPLLDENIATLMKRLSVPWLGTLQTGGDTVVGNEAELDRLLLPPKPLAARA